MSGTPELAPGSISLRAAHPVVIDPVLAKTIGLNEAIILQQIRYWIENPKVGRDIDGQRWIHNTYDEWQENFPFWSIATIRRAIASLEEMQLISVRQDLGEYSRDRTKWYTINAKHPAFVPDSKGECADATAQNEQMDVLKMSSSNSSECADVNKNRDYTETTTETTSVPAQPARPRRRAVLTPIPDDFAVTEDLYTYAFSKGLTAKVVDYEFERFVNHALSLDRRAADWKRAFQNWLLKTAEDMTAGRGTGPARAGSPSRVEDPERRNWTTEQWFED